MLLVALPRSGRADSANVGDADNAGLAEIVVTAQRRSENLEKTPVAVSVVSGEDLSKRQIVSESDLQAAVPGLTVRATSSSEQLNYAIRGQSVDAFSGSRPAVLPYIDEVQVNNNSSTAFYDLASVQVLKGPQGTLFGRNATGGAVLFTTAKPTDEVTLLPGDITEGAPVLGGDAHSGQRWQIGDLLEAMIMYSDNIASNALISHFGFPAINATIRRAGMTGTSLARHFAGTVPPGRQNMNVTTPGDIAMLLYEIERGSHEGITTIASVASCRAMIKLMLRQQYREMIPAGITRNVPIANKTGELDYVRSDAAIVDPMGEAPYVLVILTKELDYPGLAYPDIAAIAKRIDTGMRRIAAR